MKDAILTDSRVRRGFLARLKVERLQRMSGAWPRENKLGFLAAEAAVKTEG